jgi:hypothetical protein
METTAVAGSTFVGPSGVAVRRTGSPVARHGDGDLGGVAEDGGEAPAGAALRQTNRGDGHSRQAQKPVTADWPSSGLYVERRSWAALSSAAFARFCARARTRPRSPSGQGTAWRFSCPPSEVSL